MPEHKAEKVRSQSQLSYDHVFLGEHQISTKEITFNGGHQLTEEGFIHKFGEIGGAERWEVLFKIATIF